MSRTLSQPRSRPKREEVVLRLEEIASELRDGMKLPTVVELKAELGVSLGTLNSALGELQDRGVLYRVHGSGIFAAPSKAPTVALICDPTFFRGHEHSPFWDALIEAAQTRADKGRERLELHFSRLPWNHSREGLLPSRLWLNEGLAREIESGRVGGVLAVGLGVEAVRWIQELQVPVVAFACGARWTVLTDGRQTVQLGVQNLLEQGCERIAICTREDDTSPALVDDLKRESSRLESLELAFVDEAIAGAARRGRELAERVFGRESSKRPDGLVFTNDEIARGALDALRELGVRIGVDVQIATHANRGTPVLEPYLGEVTRLEFDASEIVDTMFCALEAALEGRPFEQLEFVVAPRVRASTKGAFAASMSA